MAQPCNSISGSTSGGTLTELIAIGASDTYLTANPTHTMFRKRYMKHTKFAMEPISQQFNTQVGFGMTSMLTMNRTGDLALWAYIEAFIPGLRAIAPSSSTTPMFGSIAFPCCDSCDPANDGPIDLNSCGPNPASSVPLDDPFGYLSDIGLDVCTGLARPNVAWTNAIGFAMIRCASIMIGGSTIDTVFSLFLFAWEELSGKAGKRLTEMVGRRFTRAQLVEDSAYDRVLYIPLPFSFFRDVGYALPLVSLSFHAVTVNVVFEELQRLISVSDCGTQVVKARDCSPIGNNDLRAYLLTTFAFLDRCERERFANGCFEQLVTQVQRHTITQRGPDIRLTLNFNHPTKELIVIAQRQAQILCGNHFNFSGRNGRDPLKYIALSLNNLNRFAPRDAAFFRLVAPWQHHSSIPDSYVYVIPFALCPEEAQPSGSLNLSRIDSTILGLTAQDGLDEDLTINVFSLSINLLRFRDGIAGLAFSS